MHRDRAPGRGARSVAVDVLPGRLAGRPSASVRYRSVSSLHRGSAVTGLEEPERALADEVEGVRHDRVEPVLVETHLDDGTLGGRQIDGLCAPVSLVSLGKVHALLDDLVEDRADHVEAGVDAWPGVQDEDAHG